MPVILVVIILVCLNSSVFFANRTLIPFGWFYGSLDSAPYDYRGPTPDGFTSVDPYAAVCASYALDAYSASNLREGNIPFWNPYQGLGQPLLANYYSAVLYPPNWLHLVLPPAWWDVVYLLNWLLAAVFLFMYLRVIGVDLGSSLIGSAAILSNGHFQFALAQREVIGTAAWWPLLLYGVERTIREPGWGARHWVLALGVYCSITGGQPGVTFLSLFVVLVYALIRLAKEPRQVWRRGFIALVPGSLAGLLLAAPTWINFANYAFKQYSSHPTGAPIGEYHLGLKTLATYFFPFIYGRLHTLPFGEIDGFEWLYSPGWFPLMGLFLAFVSLSSMRKPRRGFGFLVAVAAIMMAKIWGVPGIHLLGKLPFFETIWFSRFGAFLLAFSLAGLAANGIAALAQLEAGKWMRWVMAWFILVVALFIMGVMPIWPVLNQGSLLSGESKTIVGLGALGLAWAIFGPLGLWWIKSRRPAEHGVLYSLAACAILLQGVAYACNGYTSVTYVILSSGCLAVYLLLALVIGLVPKIQLTQHLIASKLMLVALPPLCVAFFAPHGLPLRYNPLKPPPYLATLVRLQNNNIYRSYSFDGLLFPNFAAPFRVTSLDSLDAVLPFSSAVFMRRFLDRGAEPLFFAANHSAGRKMQFRAINEFFENRRYFDLVGVRYLVTMGTEPIPFFYSGERFPVFVQLDKPLEATLRCPFDSLSEIEVCLSTYMRTNPGEVTLRVFGPDSALLRRARVAGSDLRDNSFQKFAFAPIHGCKNRQLTLQLEFQPEQQGSMIAAWVFPDHPEWGFFFRALDGTKKLPLVYEDERGVRIWENPEASPRVFLAPEAGVASSWQDAFTRLQSTPDLRRKVWLNEKPGMESTWPAAKPAGHLLSFRVEPNDIWLTYQAETSGILTVTDSYLEGWRAEVNGKEFPVLRVDGVFRGVRIPEPGVYRVRFWYRPVNWNQSLGMACVGLVIVVVGSLLSYRKKSIQEPSEEESLVIANAPQ